MHFLIKLRYRHIFSLKLLFHFKKVKKQKSRNIVKRYGLYKISKILPPPRKNHAKNLCFRS
jgi:hypothetical protein